ncbi:MAG: cell envelope integrity protein TolA [Pseudomonadales bacterium]|nr:cell envelope integrity protein TolA [Pseudomonadales bacterium]
MSGKLIDWPSLAKAVGIHVVLVAIFLVSWNFGSKAETVREIPAHINAVVVERPKPVQQKPVEKKTAPKTQPKKVEKKPKQAPKKTPKPTPKPKEPPKPKPDIKKKPVVKKPQEPKKVIKKQPQTPSFEDLLAEETKELKIEERKEQQHQEELERIREQQEQQQLEFEKKQREDAQRIASELETYKVLIQQTMRRYWKRPPVAREDLVVKLSIRLLPGGELNDVKVSESSGNSAFDRSAVTAVMKAGRFSVPSDPAVFDKHFRSFTMIFNPNEI